MPRKARDCTRCVYFRGFHPKYPDSFGCSLDPYCSWMEYKKKKESVSSLKNSAEQFLEYVQDKDTLNSETSFYELCEATDNVDKLLDSTFFKMVSIVPRVKHGI